MESEGKEREGNGKEGQRYEELEDKHFGYGKAIVRRVNQTQRRMPELRALSRSPFCRGILQMRGKVRMCILSDKSKHAERCIFLLSQ